MPAPEFPPLDKLNPVQAWQPWQPSEQQPWNLKWAGHLYRRAGFGAPLSELRQAVDNGYDKTIDLVLKGDPEGIKLADQLRGSTGEATTRTEDPQQLRGWWYYWMLNSGHPLREKMTLFWHNHFATSIHKVQRPELMLRQNQLLYRHALGSFRTMLEENGKDPAMLLWLDSNSNVAGKPNENYAREVMELFSLGVGNYTEKDIREAARAFTGWHTDGEKFTFIAGEHDGGKKTVLGQAGDWDGGDVVRILLEQAAAPRFLVRKLYRYFISENAHPPDALLQPLADAFKKSDYDIAGLIHTMLRSRHFFSAHAYRQRIKSPVEFVLGGVQQVGRSPTTGQFFVQPKQIADITDMLGQSIFAPPNVKGWRHGQTWLNTATVLARANLAEALTNGRGQFIVTKANTDRRNVFGESTRQETISLVVDPAAFVRLDKLTDPPKIVDLVADILLQGDLPEAARTRLVNYLAEAKPRPRDAKPRDDDDPPPPENAFDTPVRDVFHAVMTMPEYQLA